MLIKTLCKYLSFLLSLTFRLLMRSARIVKTNNPLVIEDRPGPKLKNSRVLVRVKAAGICHSDLHLREGGYMGARGKFMKVKDPGSHIPFNPWPLGFSSS
jgi:hypothetical protein